MEEGKNIFTIEYELGVIKDFEKKILSEGLCESFLPMSFVSFGGIERANYDCSGYQPMANHELKSSREMIDLLEKCVFALIRAREHLMDPRKMELNARTVFYSNGRKDIKFAYVPKKLSAEKVTRVFTEFLEHMEKNVRSKDMCNYLRSVTSYIEYSNGSLLDVVNYLGELRKEIHACG